MIIDIIRQAMYTIILVSAPMLGIGLIVGLIISIFQATTQINEQTLVFVPKIIAIFASIVLFGPWMLNKVIDFTTKLYGSINFFIK